MSVSSYKLAEIIESATDEGGTKKCLLITKAGKFLRGSIIEHNVRVSSDGKVRGRIVFLIDGQKKEIDASDLTSIEITK